MSLRESNKAENIKADIVIIGGGGAGLSAAVAAAEIGAKNIVVLEKRNVTGGTSATAGGPFAAESPAQRRQSIIALKDDLFKIMMEWSHLKINPRIVRAYIERSADTIRWLEAKGLFFICSPHSPLDNPLTWHLPEGTPSGGGAAITKILTADCMKLGVKLLLKTQAKRILLGEKGNVTGVLAEKDGREIKITSSKAIITTGGFGANRELLKKYCPNYQESMRLYTIPNMGDGLNMALEAGAATEGLGNTLTCGPVIGQRSGINLGKEPNVVKLGLMAIGGEPAMVWVNKKGRRFINEMAVFNYYRSINPLLLQPEGILFMLFDTGVARNISQYGIINSAGTYKAGEPTPKDKLPDGLEKELSNIRETEVFKMADSWDEIADWIGADHKVLKATVEEYNAGCDRGYDPIFGKDRVYLMPLRTPPYYAMKGVSTVLNTLGGIKINENMEVLDKDANPIPGLYAAGVDAGGWVSDTYSAILPGTAFGFALNSGRIAGENAFKSIDK